MLEWETGEGAHHPAHPAHRLGGDAVPVHVHDGFLHALRLHDGLGLRNRHDVLRPRLLTQPFHERRAHAEPVRAVHHNHDRGLRVLRHDGHRPRERLDVVRGGAHRDDHHVGALHDVRQVVGQHARRIHHGDLRVVDLLRAGRIRILPVQRIEGRAQPLAHITLV